MAPTRWRRRATGWLDALWPRACAGCGDRLPGEVALCALCDARLADIPAAACSHCQEHPARLDGGCAQRPRGDPLDAGLASVWLEEPSSDWIHAFKYPAAGLPGLAPAPIAAACALAVRASARAGPAPGLVVPVPLHPRRLRTRGFNPAAILARAVARSAGVAWDPVALERLRDTPSQTGLDQPARRRNVAGCMRSRRELPQRIWLVDDVLTTGATAREAARALRAGGALQVIAIAAARAPRRPGAASG